MKKNVIIILIILISFPTVIDADNIHVTYVSLVDPNLGFYKVTDSTTHKPAQYVNRVLTINQGDNVIWKNDADPSAAITIVSEQNLFPDTELKLINDVFSYTFDQSGIFTFYIKERELAKQTIIVNAVGVPVITNTPVTIPNITETVAETVTETINESNITENGSNVTTTNISDSSNESITNDNNTKKDSLSVTSIASIMIAILSLLMMFSTRKR